MKRQIFALLALLLTIEAGTAYGSFAPNSYKDISKPLTLSERRPKIKSESNQDNPLFNSLGNQEEISNHIDVKEGSGFIYSLDPVEIDKRFHQIAQNSRYEDSWIRYAGIVKDVGTSLLPGKTKPDIQLIFETVKEHYERSYDKSLTYVHNHPLRYHKEGEVFPPNSEDIIFHANLQNELKKYFPALSLKSEVYDGRGKWTFEIPDNFLEKLNEAFPNSMPGEDLGLMFFYMRTNRISEKVNNDSSSRPDKIKAFIDAYKEKGINLEYQDLSNNTVNYK